MHEMMGGKASQRESPEGESFRPHLDFRPAAHTRERFLVPGLAVPRRSLLPSAAEARTRDSAERGREGDGGKHNCGSKRAERSLRDAEARASSSRSTTRPRTSRACSPTSRPAGAVRRGGPADPRRRRLDGRDDRARRRRYRGPLPVELVRLDAEPGPRRAFRAGFAAALAGADDDDARRHARGGHDQRPRRAAGDARASAPTGADLVLADWQMVNVGRVRRLLSSAAGFVVRRGARPGRPDGLLVLPRLPRLGAPARLRPLRRRPDPRARLRLQGGDPRQADAAWASASTRCRSRSTGAAALGESKMPVLRDDARLLADALPPARRSGSDSAVRERPPERRDRRRRHPRHDRRVPARAGRRARRALRARARPRRARRLVRLRRHTRSTASTTSSCRRTTACSASPRSSASATASASGRRRSASTATAGCSR